MTIARPLPHQADLGLLLEFLARADDVISVIHGQEADTLRIPIALGGEQTEIAPIALVTTDRHRVWLVRFVELGDTPATLEGLALWCREQTLREVDGRTFRALLLQPSALPVASSISSFEALAVLRSGR